MPRDRRGGLWGHSAARARRVPRHFDGAGLPPPAGTSSPFFLASIVSALRFSRVIVDFCFGADFETGASPPPAGVNSPCLRASAVAALRCSRVVVELLSGVPVVGLSTPMGALACECASIGTNVAATVAATMRMRTIELPFTAVSLLRAAIILLATLDDNPARCNANVKHRAASLEAQVLDAQGEPCH